nr:MAG TPA: hypothetical protein [Bacteriophage sp.]
MKAATKIRKKRDRRQSFLPGGTYAYREDIQNGKR